MIFKLKKYYNNLEIHDNLIQLEAIDLFNQKKTFEIQKKLDEDLGQKLLFNIQSFSH